MAAAILSYRRGTGGRQKKKYEKKKQTIGEVQVPPNSNNPTQAIMKALGERGLYLEERSACQNSIT